MLATKPSKLPKDVEARIVNPKHQSYVKAIARKIYKSTRENVALEDLEQAGQYGLVKASRNYDESKGTAFTTYAYRYIWGAIKQELRDKWQPVHIGSTFKHALPKFKDLDSKGVSDEKIAIAISTKDKTFNPQEVAELRNYSKLEVRVLAEELLGEEFDADKQLYIPDLSPKLAQILCKISQLKKTTAPAIAVELNLDQQQTDNALIQLQELEAISISNEGWVTTSLERVAIANIKSKMQQQNSQLNYLLELAQQLVTARVEVARIENEIANLGGEKERLEWLIKALPQGQKAPVE